MDERDKKVEEEEGGEEEVGEEEEAVVCVRGIQGQSEFSRCRKVRIGRSNRCTSAVHAPDCSLASVPA